MGGTNFLLWITRDWSGLLWITQDRSMRIEISTQEKNMLGVRKGSKRFGIAEKTEVSNVCEWEGDAWWRANLQPDAGGWFEQHGGSAVGNDAERERDHSRMAGESVGAARHWPANDS